MSFNELIKDVANLLTEANKWDKNQQQKNFLKELRSINKKLQKQERIAKRNLFWVIIISSFGSGIVGYLLNEFL